MSRLIDLKEIDAILSNHSIGGEGHITIADLADILAELLPPEEAWQLVRLLSQREK